MSESTQAAGQENTATPAQDGQSQPGETLLTGGNEKPVEKQGEQDATAAEATQQGKPDGEQSGSDDQSDGDKPKEGDKEKDGKQEGPPEKYDLKAPEGFEQLDPVLLEQFEPVARELGLSNEAAQKLVETQMPKVIERITEQHREAWGNQIEAWVSEVKADKEIGGEALGANLEAAKRAIDKFGTPELKALIDYPSQDNPKGLGLGNHPELVRVFARIGKAMADDTFENGNGNGAGGRRDPAEILYGNSQ